MYITHVQRNLMFNTCTLLVRDSSAVRRLL